MTSVTLPNVGIKAGFLPAEDGWSDEMNHNLRLIDALVQAVVVDKDLAAPPGSPAAGSMYIVAASPTGGWSGHASHLAVWQVGDDLTSAWTFVPPSEGWRVYVVDEDIEYRFNGTAWVGVTGEGSYRQTIGDGSAANFFVDHNLGTRDVHVTVYRNASPWDDILCDISRPSTDQVEVSGFGSAPGVDAYVIVVSK